MIVKFMLMNMLKVEDLSLSSNCLLFSRLFSGGPNVSKNICFLTVTYILG